MRALFLVLVLLLSLPSPLLARSADAERALSTAKSLVAQGLPDAALVKLREARSLAPDDVEVHIEYIDLMLAEQFPTEVLAEYEEYRLSLIHI